MSDSPDRFVSVTKENYGQRLVKSFAGVVVGVVLFFSSFGLLWWNEGNVVKEHGALEELRTNVSPGDVNVPSADQNNSLLHLQGEIKAPPVSDHELLKPIPYLVLDRRVEMFQWIEDSKTETREKVGGTKETTTTYTYRKGWAPGHNDSSQFKKPEGHNNPHPALEDRTFRATGGSFGAYEADNLIETLSSDKSLVVEKSMVKPQLLNGRLAPVIRDGKIHYVADARSGEPQIGDLRVSYNVLSPGPFSVIGSQASPTSLEPYTAKNGRSRLLVHKGTLTAGAMIEAEKSAASTMANVFRFLGFAIMWMGLTMVTGPITAIFNFIPFIAQAGRAVLGAITFVIAFVLSAATIVIGMIAHHPVVLAVTLLALGGGVFYLYKRRKKQASQGGQQQLEQKRAA